jgi:hypothetical protein
MADTITSTSSGDVPDFLKPYITQLLEMSKSAASTPYAGLNSYYTATGGATPFTAINPLLKKSYTEAEDLGPAAELTDASRLAKDAGIASLGAGTSYLNSAGDAGSVSKYMSPFMQNVVEQQKREAMRDAARKAPGQQAQSIRMGGRGGTRDALLQAESNRGLQESLQKIQTEGSEKAFNNAQDILKTGADVGLRGYGQGITAANALNTIGSNVFGQKKDAIMTRNTLGNDIYGKEDVVNKARYADFKDMNNDPMNRAKFMSGIIGNVPVAGRSTESTPGSDSTSDWMSNLASLFASYFGKK